MLMSYNGKRLMQKKLIYFKTVDIFSRICIKQNANVVIIFYFSI